MLLVDDLLLLPVKGLVGILRRIGEMADRELTDREYMLERLLELRLRYEMDEIDEPEYDRQAAPWEAKLEAADRAAEEAERELTGSAVGHERRAT